MAIIYAYEPEYRYAGWFDGGGRTVPSWFDYELVEDPPKKLAVIEPETFLDADLYFVTPPIAVEVFVAFFDDEDLLFTPASVRPLWPPDKMLKNEVRRVR